MLVVSEPQISSFLNRLTGSQCRRLLDALSDGLSKLSSDAALPKEQQSIHQPLRIHISHRNGDQNIFMPSSDGVLSTIKILSRPGSGGDSRGLVSISRSNGEPLGLLGAGELTAFRTALATMTIYSRTSFPKRNVVVFGAGSVASWHARLAVLLYPDQIKRITFINRGRKGLHSIIEQTAPLLHARAPNLLVETLSKEQTPEYEDMLKETLATSDTLFCCTASEVPLFPHKYLESKETSESPRQRFIGLVGSHRPHMQEIGLATLTSGDERVYVDSRDACLEEAGEIIMGGIQKDQLVELGEVFPSGNDGINASNGDNVVYKSVGIGYMDLVVGKKLLDFAKEEGLGVEV